MATDLHYNVSPGYLGKLTQRTGALQGQQAQTQLATQLAMQEIAAEQNQQRLDEAARQFDEQMAQRAYESAARQNAYRDQLAASVYNNQIDNQRMLAQEQIQQQAYNDRFGMQQQAALAGEQFDYEVAGVDQLNEEAGKVLAELRKANLDPEGVRHLHKLSGELRAIQSEALRPAQRQQALGEWFSRLERENLNQYEQREPTAAEKIAKRLIPLEGQVVPEDGTRPPPGLYWQVVGSRNGEESVKPLYISDPDEPFKKTPLGTYYYIKPDGTPVEFSPEKPPTPEKPTPGTLDEQGNIPEPDFDKQYDAARARLITKKSMEAPEGITPKAPTHPEVIAEMSEYNTYKKKTYHGTSDNPINLSGVDSRRAKALVDNADQGTVFIDEQGRRFVKP